MEQDPEIQNLDKLLEKIKVPESKGGPPPIPEEEKANAEGSDCAPESSDTKERDQDTAEGEANSSKDV